MRAEDRRELGGPRRREIACEGRVRVPCAFGDNGHHWLSLAAAADNCLLHAACECQPDCDKAGDAIKRMGGGGTCRTALEALIKKIKKGGYETLHLFGLSQLGNASAEFAKSARVGRVGEDPRKEGVSPGILVPDPPQDLISRLTAKHASLAFGGALRVRGFQGGRYLEYFRGGKSWGRDKRDEIMCVIARKAPSSRRWTIDEVAVKTQAPFIGRSEGARKHCEACAAGYSGSWVKHADRQAHGRAVLAAARRAVIKIQPRT